MKNPVSHIIGLWKARQNKSHQHLQALLVLTGPLKPYTVQFGLERLVPGVDNVRYDAYIGSEFHSLAGKFIYGLMSAQLKNVGVASPEKVFSRNEKELEAFKLGIINIMQSAINRAKQAREHQVVLLAHTALARMLMNKIREQFEEIVQLYRQTIRKHEVSHTHDLGSVFRVKEDMAAVQQKRMLIIRSTAKELLRFVYDIWEGDLEKSFISNFGKETIPPREFFLNPVFFVDGAIDDFFMMEEYALMSNRVDDPIRYDGVLKLLRELLAISEILPEAAVCGDKDAAPKTGDDAAPKAEETAESHDAMISHIDMLLCRESNIETLFDSYHTKEIFKKAKKDRAPKDEILLLKNKVAAQRRLFDGFYKSCKKSGLLKAVVAAHEIAPVVSEYCPPLLPHDIVNYLIDPAEREKVISKLKRLKSLSGGSVSLKELDRLEKRFAGLSTERRKIHLVNFLRKFSIYHRDFRNFNLLKDGVQSVNLLEDEKTINLSRVNRMLYEFAEPKDASVESKAIRNHVILKADVRGSTEITSQLSRKGLNPASYFSLNFFDPINKILPEYGASKVFIEGDALILSIFEEEETPAGWYGVARACGLAIRILLIVQRYNQQSKQHKLPILEQGIGICYVDGPPAFLFDGDNRIMISSAINRADRLSSCDKVLRGRLAKKHGPFNLYVFSSTTDHGDEGEKGRHIRYNVNGIELEETAFKKLSQEIDLNVVNLSIPEAGREKVKVYTGTFPTKSGRYQRLIIREAHIPELDPITFNMGRVTAKRYYEVCTNPAFYEKVKKLV
ncbi:MAG: hypothetical protein ACOZBW_08755 [Thermodesulfobacteriota bacterium]